ncbi:unnamed protein product [Allacma fusca]|uniref:Uncharacterized protein n=1 Tax=Allacma fusca TaxID=39272 RepID=A0A8J2JQ59_9HEXA|nr:unnamed protein product [Allacma fusca]
MDPNEFFDNNGSVENVFTVEEIQDISGNQDLEAVGECVDGNMSVLQKSLHDVPNIEDSDSRHNDSVSPCFTVNSGSEESVGKQLEDNRGLSPSRVKGKGKKLSPRKMVSKTRRDAFIRNGKTVGKLARKLRVQTECNLFFKAQLLTATGPKTYTEGANFVMAGETVEPSNSISVEDASRAVSKTIKAEIDPFMLALKNQQLASSSSSARNISPRKRNSLALKGDCCWICRKTVFIRDYKSYPSTWFVCSGDGKPCSMSVHADCLGFAGLSAEEVKNMPNIYCRKHLGYGQVKHAEHLSTKEDPRVPTKTAQPPKRTSGRRGKSKKEYIFACTCLD